MTPALAVTCGSPEATRNLAAGVARILLPGDVLLLDGDLGAGKTTFTQGLAKAIGVDDVVTSPTFALVRSYPSSFGVDLVHVDVYRLDEVSDIVALGLPEMLEDGAIAVVEWGSRAVPALGPDYLGIRIDLTDIDGERRMTLVPEGTRWQARWEELATSLAHVAAGSRP
jgi:tRNA threonylcarbamoyladenosine biosynthesis protein TsaE